MLNYETILSSYDDKMTLMQWLKKVEEALKHASATGFRVNKKGNATISFILDFEDGTTLESGDIVLQQGESVNGAYMQNGHLFITLTNGQIFDVGNLKPVTRFEINASQHLIVYYGDGTSQDLGSLGDFSNVNFVAKTIEQTEPSLSKTISWLTSNPNVSITDIYSRVEVINNILHIVANLKVTNNTENELSFGSFVEGSVNIPEIANKIFDLNGNAIGMANGNYLITGTTALYGIGGPYYANVTNATQDYLFGLFNTNSPSNRSMKLWFFSKVAHSIPAGSSLYLTARLSLTLI